MGQSGFLCIYLERRGTCTVPAEHAARDKLGILFCAEHPPCKSRHALSTRRGSALDTSPLCATSRVLVLPASPPGAFSSTARGGTESLRAHTPLPVRYATRPQCAPCREGFPAAQCPPHGACSSTGTTSRAVSRTGKGSSKGVTTRIMSTHRVEVQADAPRPEAQQQQRPAPCTHKTDISQL